MKLLWNSLVAMWLLVAACSAAQSDARLVNGFAAIVNDRVITYEQVEAEVRPGDIEALQLQYRGQRQLLSQELNRLRQDALDLLIERELILHEFETAGYKMPENVVEEQIKDSIREDYGDNTRMIRTLQARNMTKESYRRRIREQFIVSAMTSQKISSAILISPHKIEAYYQENQEKYQLKDRVHLRTISLWNRADRNAEATRRLANELADQLKSGTTFTNLATQYSDDPARKQEGDRGWIERGSDDLRSDLQEFAFGLKPGETSSVLEKEEGCYLMLVEEFQPAHVKPLSEARDEIEEVLRRRERARLRNEWIQRLRAKSFIRLFPLN